MNRRQQYRVILSGTEEGTLLVRYARGNGEILVERADAHDEQINSIIETGYDNRFVTAGEDGDVKIWQFSKFQLDEREPPTGLSVFRNHTEAVIDLIHIPKTTIVASAGRDDVVRIFDVKQKKRVHKFDDILSGTFVGRNEKRKRKFVGYQRLACFPGKGRHQLACADGEGISLIDLEKTKKTLLKLNRTRYISSLVSGPDKSTLIAGDYEGWIYVFDHRQHRRVLVKKFQQAEGIRSMMCFPGENVLVTGGSEKGRLRIYDTYKHSFDRIGHRSDLYSMKIHRMVNFYDDCMFTCGDDGLICAYNINDLINKPDVDAEKITMMEIRDENGGWTTSVVSVAHATFDFEVHDFEVHDPIQEDSDSFPSSEEEEDFQVTKKKKKKRKKKPKRHKSPKPQKRKKDKDERQEKRKTDPHQEKNQKKKKRAPAPQPHASRRALETAKRRKNARRREKNKSMRLNLKWADKLAKQEEFPSLKEGDYGRISKMKVSKLVRLRNATKAKLVQLEDSKDLLELAAQGSNPYEELGKDTCLFTLATVQTGISYVLGPLGKIFFGKKKVRVPTTRICPRCRVVCYRNTKTDEANMKKPENQREMDKCKHTLCHKCGKWFCHFCLRIGKIPEGTEVVKYDCGYLTISPWRKCPPHPNDPTKSWLFPEQTAENEDLWSALEGAKARDEFQKELDELSEKLSAARKKMEEEVKKKKEIEGNIFEIDENWKASVDENERDEEEEDEEDEDE